MSFKATLRIFEKEYPLLDLDYGLKQQTDSNFRPTNRALDGKLYLKFASTKDDTALYDAMFSPTQTVQGMIRVYKRDGFSKSFDIEFANAYIVHLQEDYNAESEQPLSMQLIISPQIQRIRNTIFELPANPSNPFEEEAEFTERKQQEGKILECYFENKDGERDFKPKRNETIYLIVKTEDMVGKTIDCDLSSCQIDFEYNGNVLADDQIKNHSVSSDIVKIELKTIQQKP